jgi:hypothetical protein
MTINYLRGICAASIALLAMTCLAQTKPVEPRATPDAKSESKSDREKIQRVITLQLRAFERNDEAIAFSYATADTRKVFGTPRQFMDMVRLGYAPVLKHSSREFLEAANVNGLTVQPVKFLTTDGDIVVALYTMERQADNEWRIGGCELAPKSLQAT